MNKSRSSLWILIGIISLVSGAVGTSAAVDGKTILDRDSTYEQNLRWEASPDKTITPGKVIRWMLSLRGQTLAPPSKTEFQPIVNAHDGQTRFIAAIAYKF